VLQAAGVIDEPFSEPGAPLVTEALPVLFDSLGRAGDVLLPGAKAVTAQFEAPFPCGFLGLGDETPAIKGGCLALARIAGLPATLFQRHKPMQPGIVRRTNARPVR